MRSIALITGASSGIGYHTAIELSNLGFDIIGCARRKERLVQLKDQLNPETRFYALSFDVRDKDACFDSLGSLPESWKNIQVLVNNAGNAHGLAPFHEGSLEDWEAMIDINVKGLLYVSKAIIPGMIKRKSGHIVNIGSVAGKETYPGGNVYCASKYAVDALNQSLLKDLNPYGIRVSAINPGLVETEFSKVRFKGDEEKASQVYKGITPLSGKDVAEVIGFVVTRPSHVNMADVLLFPTDQASATMVRRREDPS